MKTTLLTVDKLRDADWPREALEELATMPENLTSEQILNTVSWMARGRRFDRVVALDEFDLETAALIREHMRLDGMGVSATAFYRDKLAMRTGAREKGFRVPDFCRVLNYDELRAYMAAVPAPWLLKPRTSASALGIRKIQEPEQLWRTLDELGDRQSHFVLERFVPGEIFHVDSIVSERKVVFSAAHKYGRPPMQVMHEGGVFTTRTVDRASSDWKDLTAFNAELAPGLRPRARRDPRRVHQGPRRRQILFPRDCRAGRRRVHLRPGCRQPPASTSGANGRVSRSPTCAATPTHCRRSGKITRAACYVFPTLPSPTPAHSMRRKSYIA